jgi:hypothetical protein
MLWDQVPTKHEGAATIEVYSSDLDKRVRDTLY